MHVAVAQLQLIPQLGSLGGSRRIGDMACGSQLGGKDGVSQGLLELARVRGRFADDVKDC